MKPEDRLEKAEKQIALAINDITDVPQRRMLSTALSNVSVVATIHREQRLRHEEGAEVIE